MYICICNAVKEADVHAAVAAGERSFSAVKKKLSLCSDCGQCSRRARVCFEQAKSRANANNVAQQPDLIFMTNTTTLAQTAG